MTTALSTIPETTITAIEEACEQCSLAKLQTLSPIRRTLALANGMQTIRKHLSGPLMKDIMGLADTALGFETDHGPRSRDKDGKPLKPYSEDVVRDVVIEGMLRGASIIGNELNIISARCYLTRQYFERQLREFPGLTDLQITDGVPTVSGRGDGALVPVRATWKLNGQHQELSCDHTSAGDFRIVVRVNAGMGADAILGKARRKFLARVLARVSGSQWIAEQADADGPTIDVQPVAALETVSLATAPDESAAVISQEVFRGIGQILAGKELITDVDEYQASAAALLTTEEDFCRLADYCDKRREEIRGERGTRSNAKE